MELLSDDCEWEVEKLPGASLKAKYLVGEQEE